MKPRRGKQNFKNRQKKQQKPKRERKTYSLYKTKDNNYSSKRKLNNDEVDVSKEKKIKVDLPPARPNITSSESEDEEVDNMKNLLSTFKNKPNVDSSDESVLSEEDEEKSDDETDDSDESDEDVSIGDNTDDEDEEKEDNRNETTKNDEQDDAKQTDGNEEIQVETGELDEETQKEDEDLKSCTDPFAKHLFFTLSNGVKKFLQTTPMAGKLHVTSWDRLGKLCVILPKEIEESTLTTRLIDDQLIYATPGSIPERINIHKDTLESLHIKSQIVNNLERSNSALKSDTNRTIPMTSFQAEIFSFLNNYQDFYCPERTFGNAEEIRFVYCLHAINHVLKTRTKILHHNAKLAKASKRNDFVLPPEEFRDQGLARPKVLFLVPFKSSAYKIVEMLIKILIEEDKGNVMNKNRFVEEYTGNELAMPKRNPKPEDYELTFTGNTSDDFKIGISVTKKTLKLYTPFDSSDIILASPLGLRTTIGAEGEPDRKFDFLTSIEVLIFDQAEIFLMQNWDHVLHIMNHLHLQPQQSPVDIFRIRQWSLDGLAKYYRQTIIFSSVTLPEISSIFNKRCVNYRGKVRVANEVPITTAAISHVVVQMQHVLEKVVANSLAESIDARFDYFVKKILPQQRDPLMKQTLIYVPSYFDYVKIRNYFKREDISFVQICEYTKEAKVARARDMFFHGDAHFLLYTERFHFYNRIRIKGVRHIVFYEPPSFPHFYSELCNFMQEANMNKKVGSASNMSITVLYTKYDLFKMAAIVSTEKNTVMWQSEKKVHLLVTS